MDGIKIGNGILRKLPKIINIKKYSKIFLIVDKTINDSLAGKIEEIFSKDYGIFILAGNEQIKNIATVQKIWKALLKFNCDRKSLVFNIGGGTIGDVGGFAASTYMRGIDFIQIPTTLLAQVDASVGGKVGINFSSVKNLIGTFQQPVAVIIDVGLLSSLPEREFISGFAEIIKHGVTIDKKYFRFVTSKKPLDFSQDELAEIIKRSCQIKSAVVAADEKEEGLRRLLNFGHTIGHAIESLSQQTNHPLFHGEAVSIGMIVEGKISKLIGILSEKEYIILEQALRQAGLPTAIPDIKTDKILVKIKADKKSEKGKINFTLLKGIGKAIINQQVNEVIIRKVLA